MAKERTSQKKKDIGVLEEFLSLPIADPEGVFEKFRVLPGGVEDHGEGKQGYLYVPGTRKDRCVIVAHADTYFDLTYQEKEMANQIVVEKGEIRGVSSEASIGADDRAGCAMLWLLKDLGHSLLILDGEEHGQVGAHFLQESNPVLFEEINNHSFMLQLDRRGSHDYKYYKLPVTEQFISYIEQETGYELATGKGRTDIGVLCTRICGVNLSVGYYDEHKPEEKVVIDEWLHTLDIVRKMLKKPLVQFLLKE